MPNLERTLNVNLIRWVTAKLSAYAARRRQAAAQEILQAIMPARPHVAQHQRSAALHIQLANEVGWTPRRAPAQWRGNR